MQPEMPEELARQQREEQRRRAQEGAADSGESLGAADAVADSASGNGWCDSAGCDVPDSSGCDSSSGDSGDSSGCDCDVPGCDCLLFFRLSALLGLVALLVPARDGGLVAGLVRLYRRRLTRFTPTCPSTPSCSAYALDAIERLGPRRGLRAAAARVRSCGRAT